MVAPGLVRAGDAMTISISRESFNSADEPTKLLLIYDLLTEQNAILAEHTLNQNLLCERRCSDCDKRFLKLERRKIVNTGISAIGGFFGGFCAVIAERIWGS